MSQIFLLRWSFLWGAYGLAIGFLFVFLSMLLGGGLAGPIIASGSYISLMAFQKSLLKGYSGITTSTGLTVLGVFVLIASAGIPATQFWTQGLIGQVFVRGIIGGVIGGSLFGFITAKLMANKIKQG